MCLFSSCFLIMSILAVPDHFYYSSLKSVQSASKLSGNEIPVLKALVQIEGRQTTDKQPFPLQFGDVIASSPAAQKSSRLFLLLSDIIASRFVHSSPSEGFCCLHLPHPIMHVSFRLFSRRLSSQMLHPQVHSPSQTESCNLFSSA